MEKTDDHNTQSFDQFKTQQQIISYPLTYLDKLTIGNTLAVRISIIDSKPWHVPTLPLIY